MSPELDSPLWLFVVATHLNIGDKRPPTMAPLGDCRRLMLLRNRYISSILTRNITMERETFSKPIECAIREKISSSLNPSHLSVINESYKHNVPRGSETHFRVIVVSDKFDNVSLLQRHRMVNELLKYELENGVHALSIIAKTPDQWSTDDHVMPTPKCLGGDK